MSIEGIKTALGILQYGNELKQQRDKKIEEANYYKYLQGFHEHGDDYTPDEADYDVKAYMKAQADHMVHQVQQAQSKEALMRAKQMEISIALKNGQRGMAAAYNDAQLGNYGSAIDRLLTDSYGALPDGGKGVVKPTADGQLQLMIQYHDGQQKNVGVFASKKELYEHLFNRARNTFYDPETFHKTYIGIMQKRIEANYKNLANPIVVQDHQGNTYSLNINLLNGHTGEPLTDPKRHIYGGVRVWDNKHKKYLNAREIKEKYSSFQTQQERLTESEINKNNAVADYNRHVKGNGGTNLSPREKLANYYKRVYPEKSLKEIDQMMHEDDVFGKKAEAFVKYLTDYGIDPKNEEEFRQAVNTFNAGYQAMDNRASGLGLRGFDIPDTMGSSHNPTKMLLDAAHKRKAELQANKVPTTEIRKILAQEFPALLQTH